MPPNSPSKRVAKPRAMQIPPLFQKKFEPPRNEILDTLLGKRYRSVIYRLQIAAFFENRCNISLCSVCNKLRQLQSHIVRSTLSTFDKKCLTFDEKEIEKNIKNFVAHPMLP